MKLSDDEVKLLAAKIMRPTLKYLIKTIHKEVLRKGENINDNDFIYIIVLAMTSIDANVLVWLRNTYKQQTKQDIDFNKLMTTYMEHLMQIMTDDERKRLKEKLN